MSKRVLAEVVGVVWETEDGSRTDPTAFFPPVVQFMLPDGADAAEGAEIIVPVRVRLRTFLPGTVPG